MGAERSRHVLVLGADVRDDSLYQRYREKMTPILERHGGTFGYDLLVSRVLKSESGTPMNRVFTIVFPDRSSAERFFANPEYRSVREQLFEPAVRSLTKIAAFDEVVR